MQWDAGYLPPADHWAVCADQVDPAHGLLSHLHQPPHEDMEVTQFSRLYFASFFIQQANHHHQSESDLPRQVRPQAEADGQAAAPVDDPRHSHHGNLPRNLVTAKKVSAF